LNNTAEGIITFNSEGLIESWNHAAEKLFGWNEKEVITTSIVRYITSPGLEAHINYLEYFLRDQIHKLDGHEGEMIGNHKNGQTFPLSFKASRMTYDCETKYTALVANISEHKAMMEDLLYLAEHDGLTGLYNRAYFNEELERAVNRTNRNNNFNYSLLYIDLDNFKYVNDTLGHAAGDKILLEVTQLLRQRTRKSDLLARLGGG